MSAKTPARIIKVAATLLPLVAAALPVALVRRGGAPMGRALANGFERLGPTFIKLGQFLSVRPDLAGEEFASTLERLRDSAAPLPADAIREIIRSELKKPVEELFASFDDTPAASGSIAQVHRAVTHEGTELALKIQRPEAEILLSLDLALLKTLARLAARLPFINKHLDPVALVEEMTRSCARETDFRLEAEVSERFALNFRLEDGLRIPRVHWAYTTRRVLAADYLHGSSIASARWREGSGYRNLAELGSRYFFMQVLEHGLFHCDLHPANVFITEDGKIGYLDFGIWGELTLLEREAVLGALIGLLTRDREAALANLSILGVEVPPENREAFGSQVEATLRASMGTVLAGTSVTRIGAGLLKAVRANRVRLPHKYALLIKALLTIEGGARTLHPDFDMEGAALNYIKERFLPRLGVSIPLEILWRRALLAEITCKPRSTEL